jgi:WD40 repeat protein
VNRRRCRVSVITLVRVLLWRLSCVLLLAAPSWAHPQARPAGVTVGAADPVSMRTDERVAGLTGGAPKPSEPVEVRTGHRDGVYELAFSPDGREMATTCGRGDPRVRFWDSRTGRFIRSLEAHAAGTWAVAYTPDGARLVTSSMLDKEDVCVWDARTHRKLMGLKGHKHGAHVLAISPDGNRLVSVGRYTAVDDVVVWDLKTGRQLHKHPTLAHSVERAGFLPDGRTLLAVERQRIRLWDTGASAGDRVRDLGVIDASDGEGQKPTNTLFAATAIGSGGRVVGVGEFRRTTRLLEVITGQEIWKVEAGIHDGRMAVSPDGRTIARPSWGATIELLDCPSEKAIRILGPLVLPVSKLAFSPDGKRLASVGSGSKSATVHLWDLSDIADRPLRKPAAGPKDLDRWCGDLAGSDARVAHRAVWALAGVPGEALPRLKAMIGDRMRTKPAEIDRWIAGLDHDRFAAREAAAARLTQAGTAAVERMERALKVSQSAEQRRRLQAILDAIRESPAPADRLFAARARMVLEQIGTPEAWQLLDEWARAAPEADRASEARAVVGRLAKQQKDDP